MKKILLRILMAIGIFILIIAGNLFIFSLTASKITEGEPISKSGPGQTALLVIDIQGGTTGETSALQSLVDQSEELIENVNRATEEARAKNWTVIYIQTEVANPLLNLINNTMKKGTAGAELDKRLAVQSDPVITKRKNDSFNGTNLDEVLKGINADKLVITGLDATQCVNHTIQAALNRGYQVAVISDAVISKEEADKTRAIGEFRDMGVEIIE